MFFLFFFLSFLWWFKFQFNFIDFWLSVDGMEFRKLCFKGMGFVCSYHHTLILDSRCHRFERTGTAINNPSLKFERSWNNNETSQPCIRHWLTIQNQAEQNKGNHFESDTRKPFMSWSTSQEAFICSRVWLLISSTLHRKKETSIHNNRILHHFATPASYCIAHFSNTILSFWGVKRPIFRCYVCC